MIWLALLGVVTGLIGLFVWWACRPLHLAAKDEPVPYWPTVEPGAIRQGPPAPNPCTWCKPSPQGDCTCAGKCGHGRCVGDWTSMATLTAADMRLLHKWIREGQE